MQSVRIPGPAGIWGCLSKIYVPPPPSGPAVRLLVEIEYSPRLARWSHGERNTPRALDGPGWREAALIAQLSDDSFWYDSVDVIVTLAACLEDLG